MALKNDKRPAARKGKNADKKKDQREKVAPADWKVEEHKSHQGTVAYFNKNNGYGFIKPAQSGLVPNDEVIVVWNAIKTTDRWPFLYKNLEVQFKLVKTMKKDGSGCYIKAAEVRRADGSMINLQDELNKKREFVHNESTRFTGTVKFYNMRLGFGIITLDDGFLDIDHIPKELRVSRQEIVTANGEVPMLRADMKVEFGIQINLKGTASCFCVTYPGGHEFSRTQVEERKTVGGGRLNGTVAFYNVKAGWGYLKPSSMNALPPKVREMVENDTKKTIEKKGKDMEPMIYFRRSDCKTTSFVRRGDNVTFEVYCDHRGAGAFNVSN